MLAGLIVTCALAADPALAVEPLGPARPDGLLRVAVQVDGVAAPARLTARLLDGGAELAAATATLPAGGRAILVLVPGGLGSGRLRVSVSAAWEEAGQPRLLAGDAAVATPNAALAEVAALIARLRTGGDADPQPWLWAEQAAELVAGGASAASIGAVSAVGSRLAAWLAGDRAMTSDRALRDPVDGSVQPYRLHLPRGDGPHPLLVLLPAAHPALGKAQWPATDARLVDAALAAGVAVVECYPAGDLAWSGAARRRIALTIAAAAAAAPLDLARGACIGACGEAGLPYALHRLPSALDAGWCRGALGPPRPTVPGDGWADAPFAVVVGSAEHAAAAAANQRLAGSFRAAYAAHAHAVVELLDDRVEPARLDGRNLVLIGNPRSNRVLAALRPELPWRWDHRSVTGVDGASVLRATMPPLACRTRLADGRGVIILDGPPPAWGPGLPLADLR